MEGEAEKRMFSDEERINDEMISRLGYARRPLVRAAEAEAMLRRSQACDSSAAGNKNFVIL